MFRWHKLYLGDIRFRNIVTLYKVDIFTNPNHLAKYRTQDNQDPLVHNQNEAVTERLTLSHLSTHLVWNSWRHGNTRNICRSSKSHMQITHVVCLVSDFSPVYLEFMWIHFHCAESMIYIHFFLFFFSVGRGERVIKFLFMVGKIL